MLANCHRDPKRPRAFKPGDFDPFSRRSAPVKGDISVLKDVFIDGKFPGKECEV
ncbi:MAG: hypothetical protein GY842_27545 [bacterium]|nr:hypothetical protein [bacterium]